MQELADISFCPINLQVLIYLAWELCRQIAACILSRLTPFYYCGGSGSVGGGHFEPEV